MSVVKLLANVELGRAGKNIGISTGLPVIDTVIYGIQRKFLYVVGADTSGGKTSFVNDAYVYNLLKNAQGKKINILYYSFEMEASILFAKLLSRYIYDTYAEIITYEEILSLKTSLTDEHYRIIQESLPWLKELETHLFIYDKALPPKGIYATCKQWLEKFGVFEKIDDHREQYVLDDPEHFLEVIVDHIGSNWALFKVI